MYKIPLDFDVNKIKNTILTQICYCPNCIFLYFDNVGIINIWGNLKVSFDKNESFYNEIFPIKNDFGMLSFLECKVFDISIGANREALKLVFDNNGFIELIGNDYNVGKIA